MLDFYVFVQHAAEFVVVSIPLERFLSPLLEEPFPILRRAKVSGSSGQQAHIRRQHSKNVSVHKKSAFPDITGFSTWQLVLVFVSDGIASRTGAKEKLPDWSIFRRWGYTLPCDLLRPSARI